MATTVNIAFDEFMKNYVNLNPGQVQDARKSRNWLIKQINNFPSLYVDFPNFYEEKHFGFGSFARSTKKRKLDDIDYLFCISADGATYTTLLGGTVQMVKPGSSSVFDSLTQTINPTLICSIKVINRFKKYLNKIPQYEAANIKRNEEAATLKLTSYDWNFDIVPCFFTEPESDGRSYYIIPDGKGNWKKTDPIIDKNRTTNINKMREGNVLKVIRIMKYWNKRPTMPSMDSYLLENMILDYYENNEATSWVDLEVKKLFAYIHNNILSAVNDPKNIQGDINTLKIDEKQSIRTRAKDDYYKSKEAIENEISNTALAMKKWESIFGPNFPKYTG